MKINISSNKTDSGQSLQSFKALPQNPRYYPEALAKLGKLAGEYISMPEQKMFAATTALMLQPLMDLKFADDDKKIDTAIKSASKSIAGGFTGVVIRALCTKMTSRFIAPNKRNIINYQFLPSKALKDKFEDPAKAAIKLKQYNQSLGTLFAILIMVCVTNSKIDVPLTSDIQDIISGVVKENKTWKKSLTDVVVKRKKKITDKLEQYKNIANTTIDKFKKIKDDVIEVLPKKIKGRGK